MFYVHALNSEHAQYALMFYAYAIGWKGLSMSLVAFVWKDNRIARLDSTNSNLRNVVHADRRLHCNVIQVNQPQNIQLYNRYMIGVDCHDQMCLKYDVGCFLVNAWKYILWYFVKTSTVNAYILHCKTSTWQTQWDLLLDLHLEKGRHKP